MTRHPLIHGKMDETLDRRYDFTVT